MKKIFSYIFIFIFVFLTCYFNVSAISLRNYGGIKGYEYNGTNSYNCHGYATGVIQILFLQSMWKAISKSYMGWKQYIL